MNENDGPQEVGTFAKKLAYEESLVQTYKKEKAPRLKRDATNTEPGVYQSVPGDDPETDRLRRFGHTLRQFSPWTCKAELDIENNSQDVIELKQDFEMCWQVREASRKGFHHQNIDRTHDFIENTFNLWRPSQWVEDTFIQRCGGEDTKEYQKIKEKRDGQFETEVDYNVGIDGFDGLPFWKKRDVVRLSKSMCLEHIFGYLGSDIKSFGPEVSMTKAAQLDDMLNYIDLAVKVEPKDGESSRPYYLGIDVTISEEKGLKDKVSGEIKQIESQEILDFIGPVMFDGQAVEMDASFVPIKICLDKNNTMKLIESFYNEVVCGVVKGDESYGPNIPDDVESYLYMFLDEIVQQLDLFEAILLKANPAADSVLGQRLLVVQKAHEDFKNKYDALSLKKTKKIANNDQSYKKFKKLIAGERKKYPV